MTEALVRLGSSECIEDATSLGEISPLRGDETVMAAPASQQSKPSRKRSSRTSKKAELESLEDKMEEKMRQNIETRFASFEEKILNLLSAKQTSAIGICNTSGGCSPCTSNPTRTNTVTTANNYTSGVSSACRNIIPLENSLNDELLRPSRPDDDILSIQPGQREKRCLDLESEILSGGGTSHTQSEDNVFDNIDSRFSKYKSLEGSEENGLKDIFGEDACTGKDKSSNGIVLDKSQTEILSESWRSCQPDKMTAYKENYKSSVPIHEKSEDLLKVPSLDDIVETFLIKRFSTKACCKRARSLHTQHLREIERLAYQGQLAAKIGISISVYMQQALRVLLQELKTGKPNLDLAVQTVRDVFAMSTKTLDQIGRSGAYHHIIRRKATIVDMGLENIKDVAKQADLLPLTADGVMGSSFETKLKDRKEKNKEMKDLIPEIETKKNSNKNFKRKASNFQYGDKQRRYNDSSRNFNSRSYSSEYNTPLRQIYNNNTNYRSGYSYKGSGQRKSTVSSFRDKSKK